MRRWKPLSQAEENKEAQHRQRRRAEQLHFFTGGEWHSWHRLLVQSVQLAMVVTLDSKEKPNVLCLLKQQNDKLTEYSLKRFQCKELKKWRVEKVKL